jgi:hypothetical protein
LLLFSTFCTLFAILYSQTLFSSTFSCELFSPASGFTDRKKYYLPSGNLTFVCKEQLLGNSFRKKNTGGGELGMSENPL